MKITKGEAPFIHLDLAPTPRRYQKELTVSPKRKARKARKAIDNTATVSRRLNAGTLHLDPTRRFRVVAIDE
jgi:hypothetical protein